jgi:hypothetical protein
MCSNWNSMFSEPVSSFVISTPCLTVASGASPTVMQSYLDNTSRFISARWSSSFGPLVTNWKPGCKKPGRITGASVRLPSAAYVLEIMLMTSMRKPSTPFLNQKCIMSKTSARTFGFSQFRSGCFFENMCRKYSPVASFHCQAEPLKAASQLFGSLPSLPSRQM